MEVVPKYGPDVLARLGPGCFCDHLTELLFPDSDLFGRDPEIRPHFLDESLDMWRVLLGENRQTFHSDSGFTCRSQLVVSGHHGVEERPVPHRRSGRVVGSAEEEYPEKSKHGNLPGKGSDEELLVLLGVYS